MSASFDKVATSYDDSFTNTKLGRWLREITWKHFDKAFEEGSRLLELSCGTGEDAIYLAETAESILATDVSEEMLRIADEKIRAAELENKIETTRLDLNRFPDLDEGMFDGVYSNFGGLNCVEDLELLSSSLASNMKTDAKAVFVVMGPYCPWEWFTFVVQGRPRMAFRRFGKKTIAVLKDGSELPVYYPRPRELWKAFSQDFDLVKYYGVGVTLPPSYLNPLVERYPTVFDLLRWKEDILGKIPIFAWTSDHYVITLKKKS